MIGEAHLGHEVEKLALGSDHFRTAILGVLNRAWRVDGRVAVDGAVRHASHPRQFEAHVRILAARIGHFDRRAVLWCHRLNEPHGTPYLRVEVNRLGLLGFWFAK